MTEGQPCRAELHSPHSGITLRLGSPMPALQLYAGQLLDQVHPQLGRGICLEPQGFPNAPNQPGFLSTFLRPGQTYRYGIRYRLQCDGR